jgi:hypothetical protein
VTRKRVPSLDFERGLHWEVAGITGNQSRGSGGGGSGRRRRPAVRGGSGLTARSRGSEKAEEKRENGWRASLPHGGASAVTCGGGEVVAQQVAEAQQWRQRRGSFGCLGFSMKAVAPAWGRGSRAWGLK